MKSINFGAFWKKTDRNGKEYLSGQITVFPFGTVSVTLFPNQYKKEDNHPDYNAVFTPIHGEESKPSKEFGYDGGTF